MDNQDKKSWCEAGANKELQFVELFGDGLSVRINPEKEKGNRYVPDLMSVNGTICELKTRTTPFFQARSRYGIDPQYAVTINQKDIDYYRDKHPGLPIFFWVEWHTIERCGIRVMPMAGVWGIRLPKLDKLCVDDRLHEYQERIGDRVNATHSYVVSLQEMKRII